MKAERAFPSAAIADEFGGMTLRDWFAGMALSGILADRPAKGVSYEQAAIWSYAYADAMMAQKDKTP